MLGYREEVPESIPANLLSRLEIRAPFAGSIETRSFARTERVVRSDSLFILADTSTLYVAADLRENDWPAVGIKPGQIINLQVPAISDQTFSAKVHYVGREVSTASNSIPLIAVLDNSDGKLRPGMFVRVSVPLGELQEKLAVRPSSIVQHNNEQFIFVAVSDNQFQQVKISTGIASQEWVEITNGLQAGQQVVTEGVFLLKSELLLEGEE
jgi:cobalt-zinc-cadmium efflux system membrane fusion protein